MIIRFETQLTVPRVGTEALGRIVVPLDGSELARRALVPAEELARRTGAALELVSTKVFDGPTQPSSFLDDLADEIVDGEVGDVAVCAEQRCQRPGQQDEHRDGQHSDRGRPHVGNRHS